MNPRVANKNEQIRMSALRNRRGVLLPPERACELVSQEIETFDAFLFIGNAYNLKSFDEFCLPPVYFIKNTGYTFPFPIKFRNKDARKFLTYYLKYLVRKIFHLNSIYAVAFSRRKNFVRYIKASCSIHLIYILSVLLISWGRNFVRFLKNVLLQYYLRVRKGSQGQY